MSFGHEVFLHTSVLILKFQGKASNIKRVTIVFKINKNVTRNKLFKSLNKETATI